LHVKKNIFFVYLADEHVQTPGVTSAGFMDLIHAGELTTLFGFEVEVELVWLLVFGAAIKSV
jgi:hypothetical protein